MYICQQIKHPLHCQRWHALSFPVVSFVHSHMLLCVRARSARSTRRGGRPRLRRFASSSSGCCPRGQRVGARDRLLLRLRLRLRLGLLTRALPRPVQSGKDKSASSSTTSLFMFLRVLNFLLRSPADGRGGNCDERPWHRDAVLRRAPGGRSGAGAASPLSSAAVAGSAVPSPTSRSCSPLADTASTPR